MSSPSETKFAIIIPDGCADEPQEALGGRTPLQAARTPAMDRIAQSGQVGRASHVPAHLPAGSAVANLSLLGYDPQRFFTGRAPLEAAAQGIELGPHDWAIRCNLVTIVDQTMRDFTAGHISSDEAAELLGTLQHELGDERTEFIPGVSYRNLLIYRGSAQEPAPFSDDTRCTPPHDLTDKPITDDFPRGPGSDRLSEWMDASWKILKEHPVNRRRQEVGKLPATNIWLWGIGRTPHLPPFAQRYQVQGQMITAVDLLRGIARLVGFPCIEVQGATGYTDTDYAAKGRAAVAALDSSDLVCVHIEAPDEASHEGSVEGKIAALEAIDVHIVAPLLDALQKHQRYRVLVSPDHPTPVRTRTHSHGFVPFAIAGSDVNRDEATSYDEIAAASGPLAFPQGHLLMPYFLGEK